MQTIRLKPVEHSPVCCTDYADELAVREFERTIRVRRAHVEPYTIVSEGGVPNGTYLVRGSSGEAYRVDMVDGTGQHDTCTCPDFLSNDLGTCKHIEAVRRAMKASPTLRRAWTALQGAACGPCITVSAVGGLELLAVGKWTPALRQRYGLQRNGTSGLVVPWAGPAMRPGRQRDGVHIVHAVVPAAERLRTLETTVERERRVREAARSGRLGVDVLARPLFPYQRDGVLHLVARGRALLADDMGLGKTVQAIAACEVLRARGEAHRVLVVTPASLKDQWAREIQRYAGQQAVVIAGPAARRTALLTSDAPYLILNYELTWRELSRLQALDSDVLILDEAQRAKNFRTKTAGTLRAIPSRYAFVLTGTPVENRLDDLYALMQLVDPTVLGPLWRFNLDFHEQNDKGRVVGYKNLRQLRERIAPVVLRRHKETVLTQLPPLVEQTRFTPISKEQRELEGSYRGDASKLLATAERRALTPEEQKRLMALLLKARQACNALELCDPTYGKEASPKLDEFEQLISEILEQGAGKVLVFSEWVEMLKLAAARLTRLGVGHTMLHGGIPTEKRPSLIERFREDPELRVLLSSDAGGTGLNLQVASYVIHLDLPWNPARLDQRTARAHRLGQTRGVSVVHLCAEEGIERGIEQTLHAKRAVREAALDPSSDVDTLAAPSFVIFAKQLRDVMEATAEPGQDVEVTDGMAEELEALVARPANTPAPVAVDAAAEHPLARSQRDDGEEVSGDAEPESAPQLPAGERAPDVFEAGSARPSTPQSPPNDLAASRGKTHVMRARADNRLRLATVVLQAGFPADATKAAYEALASSIASLLDGDPPVAHASLVARIYRDLLPTGALPAAAPGVLARLHDLTTLEDHGVEVDHDLAAQVVGEAAEWVARLAQHNAPLAARRVDEAT